MSCTISDEKRMYENQLYCDVEFNCHDPKEPSGKSSFGAHKIILSMASDVFETMFYGPFTKKTKKDTKVENVDIVDINKDIFEMMIDFIYGEETKFKNVEEGCDFYYAVHKYNIKNGIKLVSLYLSKNMNPENSILIYETTLPYDDKRLKGAFFKILSEKGSEVISNKSFNNANLTTVKTIFKLDNIHIMSELDFVLALKRYVDENSKTDKNITAKIRPALNCIRFLVFSSEILCKDVLDTGLLTKDEVLSIIASHKDLTKMPEGFSMNKIERNNTRLHMIHELSNVFSSKMCIHCASKSRISNHAIWNCNHSSLTGNKIGSIFVKYKHASLFEYEQDDLITIYNTFKTAGYVT